MMELTLFLEEFIRVAIIRLFAISPFYSSIIGNDGISVLRGNSVVSVLLIFNPCVVPTNQHIITCALCAVKIDKYRKLNKSYN